MALERPSQRKQVLVQFDAELLAELDAEAREMDVNRSEAIRRAIRAFLRKHQEARWDREAAEAYRRMPEDDDERLDRAAWERAAAEIVLPYDG